MSGEKDVDYLKLSLRRPASIFAWFSQFLFLFYIILIGVVNFFFSVVAVKESEEESPTSL